MNKLFSIVMPVLVLAGLYAGSLYNFLLFHSLVEIFAIVIACGMFMVVWNTRKFLENHYLLFIGVAYLFIVLLDLIHTMTYKGMNILPIDDANVPTQLHIAARYLESLALLVSPLMLRWRMWVGYYFLAFGAIVGMLLLSILHWPLFPDCFLENAGGLTPFKKTSEYIICLILIGAGASIFYHRERFAPRLRFWMLGAIAMTILSELAFTSYISTYGFYNQVGHLLKIVSFYFIYKGIIETGLSKPYDLLFRDIKQTKDRYQSLFVHMTHGFASHRMVYDADGKPIDYIFLEVNEAFQKLTGRSDVIGKRVTDVLPDLHTDTTDWIGIYGEVATTGKSTRLESYSELFQKWYAVTAYSPALGYFVTIFEDVSERKRNETALRDSEARFKLLSDTAGQLLTTENPQARIVDLCNAVMQHLECHVFFNFLADDARGRLYLNAYSGISERQAGKIRWIEYGSAVCGCAARDRERIIAEDILHTSDTRTALVKEFDIQAYCCHPLMVQGRLIGTLSFGTRSRPRFTPEEIELMHTVADQVALAMQRIHAQRQLLEINEGLEQKVRERTAALAHTVDTLQAEISQRRSAEAELTQLNAQLQQRAAQLRALAGELTMAEQKERKRLSRILHDGLQQHLAAAKMRVGCMGPQLGDGDLKRSAEEIESMIGESIRMSRSLSADLSPSILHEGGLAAGLEWLARSMRDKHGLTVDVAMQKIGEPPEDVKIMVFESVRELLFNTVKHAGVTRARLSLSRNGHTGLTVRVSDEGQGFDPSNRVFASHEGGFGLFSIRERIGLVGGTVQIDSAPGNGACFTLAVPYGETPVVAFGAHKMPQTESACADKPMQRPGEEIIRVLIADDHYLFRDGLTRLINREPDMSVVGQAQNGEEAIALACELRPHVILMDINMPVVDGIEATRLIHQSDKDIRIIGLSMHEEEACAQAICKAGAVDYQNKGCATLDLIAAIRAGVSAPSKLLTSVQ